ncbi:hypothetical protein HYFRA_00004017 [Hymenoscyphus fraxineus]|uniref:Uncharacterized protein n=1 Tax=Hymenoscyphus fraxineus TaxID=746836 RepID=A0A9N9PEY2_9HELO|nr:hypothetical protein HYFRA_00004017 [Hymenoscyphus fraxineus]
MPERNSRRNICLKRRRNWKLEGSTYVKPVDRFMPAKMVETTGALADVLKTDLNWQQHTQNSIKCILRN